MKDNNYDEVIKINNLFKNLFKNYFKRKFLIKNSKID